MVFIKALVLALKLFLLLIMQQKIFVMALLLVRDLAVGIGLVVLHGKVLVLLHIVLLSGLMEIDVPELGKIGIKLV